MRDRNAGRSCALAPRVFPAVPQGQQTPGQSRSRWRNRCCSRNTVHTHRLVATGVEGGGWPGKDGDGARPFTDIADRRIRSEGR